MEFLFALLAFGIFVIIAIFFIGILKWLLQGYFLYRVAEMKRLDIPLLSFVPFGTFYVGGQDYDGNIFNKGRFNPKTIGALFAAAGIIIYISGLSIGDIAISYILMESIAFIGIFKAYSRNIGITILLALLNVITVGIAAIIILFLYSRKLAKEQDDEVIFTEPGAGTAYEDRTHAADESDDEGRTATADESAGSPADEDGTDTADETTDEPSDEDRRS